MSLFSLFIFWLLLCALLDHVPGGRFLKRGGRQVFGVVKRVISKLYRRIKRIIKGFFEMTFFAPARRHGIVYGVWVFTLLPTILATLFFALFPDPQGTKGVLVLWGCMILGMAIIRYRAYRVQARARYPLPGRRRRRYL